MSGKRPTISKSSKRPTSHRPSHHTGVTRVIKQRLDRRAEGRPSEPDGSGHDRLTLPSAEAIDRCKSIPLLFGKPERIPVVECPIVYDSTASGELVGLRNATDGHIRRVRFAVGNIELEIVAERRHNAWEFVSRVYQDGRVAHRFVLRAGTRRLMADAGGFFHWTTESVPRHIRLLSFEQEVVCEVVPW